MSHSNQPQGIFKNTIIQANLDMLKLALTNLALAGIKVEVEVDDGWHNVELLHIGEQLIDGSVSELDFENVIASASFEVAPPDYITEEIDPNFRKLAPSVQELCDRGVLAVPGVPVGQI